jgi:gliding motility-associated-like protein
VIIYDVTVSASSATFESRTSCNPADTGVVVQTFPNQYGCDSVHTITITLDLVSTSSQAITGCDSVTVNGTTYYASTTFGDTIAGGSASGCDSVIIYDVTVSANIDLNILRVPPQDTVFIGDSITLTAVSDPANLNYSWSPADSVSCDTCASTVVWPLYTRTYTVVATDANGCSATAVTLVTVGSDPLDPDVDCLSNYYIPNAFTPNGDGVNDIFFIYGRGIEEMHMRIYNRWGEMVFESFSQNNGWDGTYRGQVLNPDVYVYELRIVFCDGKRFGSNDPYRKGSVTLLR